MEYDFDQWHEVTRVFWDTQPLVGDARFIARLDFKLQREMILSDVHFPSQRFTHVPSNLKSVDNEYLLFERYFSGVGKGIAGDTSWQIDDQVLHVMDFSRPVATLTTEVKTQGVLIPHHRVGFDPSVHPAYFKISLQSAEGRILMAAHAALVHAVATTDPTADNFEDAFVALIRTLVLHEPDARSPTDQDRDTGRLIRRHISKNIGNPSLTHDQICAEFGVSRTSLYRMFADEGGAMRHIVQKRLDASFLDISMSDEARGAIRRIAEKWGYHDPSHFSRAFKRRFGVSPADCLGQHATAYKSTLGEVPHPVHNWVKKA